MLLSYPKVAVSVGGGGVGETFVTSQTFREDAGVGFASEGFVHTYGQVFHLADVASGQKLVTRNAVDNTLLSHQIDDISLHETDSSLAHVVLSVWIPPGMCAANSDFTINHYKTPGSYSQSAARTLTDITGLSIELKVADFRDESDTVIGSGAFTMAVNNYINSSDHRREYATGPHRRGWETWGQFTDDTGGAPDAQLMALPMIEALSDAGGALSAVRFSAIFGLPDPFVSSKRGFRGKVSLWSGGVKIMDYAEVFTFAPSAVNTTTNRINIPNHGIMAQTPCRVTSTGTVMGGTTSGTMYYVGVYDADNIVLCSDTFEAQPTGFPTTGNVDLTSQGTGTITLTLYTELGSMAGAVTLDRNADEIYIVGTKPSIRAKWTTDERDYWLNSGMLPPLAIDAVDASRTDNSDYFPSTITHWRCPLNGTGDTEGIGPIPNWTSRWIAAQDAQGWKNIKTNACVAIHTQRGFVLDNVDSGSIICVNRGPLGDNTTPYANLTTPRPTTHYFLDGNKSADISSPPANIGGSGMEGPFVESTGPDASHWPSGPFSAYLLTGRRHFLRALWFSANRHLISAPSRFKTVNGDVSGDEFVIGGEQQLRGYAWAAREILLAGFFGENAGEKAMFRDIAQDFADFIKRKRDTYGADFQSNGWYWARDDQDATWSLESTLMRRFMAMTQIWGGVLYRGNANFAALGTHGANSIKRIVNEDFHPIYWAGVLNTMRRRSYNDTTTEPIASEVFIDFNNVVTVATDGTFTFVSGAGEDTNGLANGDLVRWFDTSLPPELSYTTSYYIINKTSTTFQISATPGGSAITFASAVGTGKRVCFRPAGPSSGLLLPNADDWGGGQTLCPAGWAKSAGHAGFDTGVALIAGRIATVGQHPSKTWATINKFHCDGSRVIAGGV